MNDMRTIQIDFDIHKAIEGERSGFGESENEVLRRLLKLGSSVAALSSRPSGRAWSGKTVTLPHGTELRMEYRGIEHHGRIDDGAWACGGGRHGGPSPAAAAVATTRSGKRPSLNGWIYWAAKLPGASVWQPISTMRKG